MSIRYMIPPYYDSMVGKIIAKGKDRAESIARLKRALAEFTINGPHTSVPLGLALMSDENFVKGTYNTAYLEGFMNETFRKMQQGIRRWLWKSKQEMRWRIRVS